VSWEALIEAVAGGGELSIVELTAHLLRHCRAQADELRRDRTDVTRSRAFAAARRGFHARLSGLAHDFVGRALLADLAGALETARSACGGAQAARALAEALDERVGPRYLGLFRGADVTLAPGDPCPIIPDTRLRRVFGRLVSHPDRLAPPIDRVSHLALAPADLRGLEVRVSLAAEDALAPLSMASRLAAALPNRSVDELTYDRYEAGGQPVFYQVRPVAPAAQRANVLRLLERAIDAGVEAVVFPELSVDAALLDELRAFCDARDWPFTLLVAGSHHVPVAAGAAGENLCVALLNGALELEHRKFSPFDLGGRREHLRPATAAITIHLSTQCSLAIAVCKDILDTAVVRVLSDLCVKLVLAPACSSKRQGFEAHATELATHAQAVTLVANTGGGAGDPPQRSCAVVGRPTAAPLLVLEASETPGLILLQGPEGRELRELELIDK
jgi:predicted amidohydrolase